MFDAATDGNMDIYGDFTAIDLASGDSIVFHDQRHSSLAPFVAPCLYGGSISHHM